jgi:hypothetical protein
VRKIVRYRQLERRGIIFLLFDTPSFSWRGAGHDAGLRLTSAATVNASRTPALDRCPDLTVGLPVRIVLTPTGTGRRSMGKTEGRRTVFPNGDSPAPGCMSVEKNSRQVEGALFANSGQRHTARGQGVALVGRAVGKKGNLKVLGVRSVSAQDNQVVAGGGGVPGRWCTFPKSWLQREPFGVDVGLREVVSGAIIVVKVKAGESRFWSGAQVAEAVPLVPPWINRSTIDRE